MVLNILPIEILQKVVDELSGSFADLHSCSLVCRSFWKATIPVLYGEIDLSLDSRRDERYVDGCWRKNESDERQMLFFRSLAEKVYPPYTDCSG